MKAVHQAGMLVERLPQAARLKSFSRELKEENNGFFNSHLYNEGPKSALKQTGTLLEYEEGSRAINAFEILNKYFDALFTDA